MHFICRDSSYGVHFISYGVLFICRDSPYGVHFICSDSPYGMQFIGTEDIFLLFKLIPSNDISKTFVQLDRSWAVKLA